MKRFVLIFVAILISSCAKESAEIQPLETISSADLSSIVYQSEGPISKSSAILIQFSTPIVAENEINKLYTEVAFQFEPELTGEMKWVKGNILAFKSTNWQVGKSYDYTVNLKSIFPELFPDEAKLLIGKIHVMANSVMDANFEFLPVNADNPNKVYISGFIEFAEETPLDIVNQSLSVKGIQKSSLQIKDSDRKRFEISSSPLTRSSSDQNFEFIFSKETAQLFNDYVIHVEIPKIEEFKILDIQSKVENGSKKISIFLSDPVLESQSISSFISINPSPKTEIVIAGKQIVIQADFIYGTTYSVSIQRGLKSKWGTALKSAVSQDIVFQDILPMIEFAQSGVVLPSDNERQIYLKAVNVKQAHIRIEHVFENNIHYFMALEKIASPKTRRINRYYYDDYEYDQSANFFSILGEEISQFSMDLNSEKNSWEQFSLDLSKFIDKDRKGIYIIRTSFTRNDIFEVSSQNNDYYRNPNNDGYYYRNGSSIKVIVNSDIGIVVKKSANEVLVQVNDIKTLSDINGAKVTAISRTNQLVAEGKSNGDGQVLFKNINSKDIFSIYVEFENDFNFVKLIESKWDNTLFQTHGTHAGMNGISAFIYTDRGVYRPGDSIYVSLIARDETYTLAENHPISVRFINPRGQLLTEFTRNQSKDGFYSFPLRTDLASITGSYPLNIQIGNSHFSREIKVETVVPNTYKVELSSDKTEWVRENEANIRLSAKFLFGSPASQANFEMTSMLEGLQSSFPEFPDYYIGNESDEFIQDEIRIAQSQLSSEGTYSQVISLRNMKNYSAPVKWRLVSKVFEKGGRYTKNLYRQIYYPQSHFVAVKKPAQYWVASDAQLQIPLLVLDSKGKPTAHRKIRYKLYINKRYWWWEYGSRESFQKKFKSDKETVEIQSGEINSALVPVSLKLTPRESGELLLELQDGINGQKTAFFMRAYSWGEDISGANADIVQVEFSKKTYEDGDMVEAKIPSPNKGIIFYSLEKADRVLEFKKIPVSGSEFTSLRFKAEADMAPNIYLSVAIVQDHAQTINDRPMRLYAINPVIVHDKSRRLALSISAPDKIKPNSDFQVTVKGNKGSQFTIAVVDEGLLDLTNFNTPDPWTFFNQKIMLNTETYDNYMHVIGKNHGDLKKVHVIGGDDYALNDNDASPEKKNLRFKPLSLFKGPIEMKNDEETVTFKMSDYIGSVKVMVISAHGRKTGKADKTITVSDDIILMPSLPRVLGPEDLLKIPVQLFITDEKYRTMTLRMDVDDACEIQGEKSVSIDLGDKKEATHYFTLKVKPVVGKTKVTFIAESNGKKVQQSTFLDIRPYNPELFSFKEYVLEKNSLEIELKRDGIKGTNKQNIRISKFPKLNINHRLEYLIHYPYGCLEQTTSSAFPQLYLKTILSQDKQRWQEIDNNINASIERLRRFKLSNGNFSYWPGESYSYEWASNYAAHFLTEAKALGYHVPDNLLSSWISYAKERARIETTLDLNNFYRLYVLAKNNSAVLSSMNILKEKYWNQMSNAAKWLLIATYQAAGQTDVSKQLMKNTDIRVDEYIELANTFGSHIRDQALILEILIANDDNERSHLLLKTLTEVMSEDTWHSTQTVAFALMAIGKYIDKFNDESAEIKGYVELSNGEKMDFNSKLAMTHVEIKDEAVRNVKLVSSSKGRLYVSYEWSGVPLRDGVESNEKNLRLAVNFVDENNHPIRTDEIKQRRSFYMLFTVKNLSQKELKNISLNQLIPSGWEIENLRLNQEEVPQWLQSYQQEEIDYFDMRDDRATWFFNLNAWKTERRFYLKINAVSAGEFYLPPTVTEAMYDRKYQAIIAGRNIRVLEN